jgi:hypothetical protein
MEQDSRPKVKGTMMMDEMTRMAVADTMRRIVDAIKAGVDVETMDALLCTPGALVIFDVEDPERRSACARLLVEKGPEMWEAARKPAH